jgi:hypothetical protein
MNTIREYKNRFNQLMESTIGNVKPLIVEQEKTVVELTDLNTQVPDSMVDSPQEVDGTYMSAGGRGEPSVVNTFTLCFGETCLKVPGKNVRFNYASGIGKTVAGKVPSVRNSFFFKPYVANGKTYNISYYLGGQLATDVLNNTEDKAIGFSNESIDFYCYVPKSGGYVCDQFTYKVNK